MWLSNLVIDGGSGSRGGQGTGVLGANDNIRPEACRDRVSCAGLSIAMVDENVQASLPTDEDSSAGVASDALEALFLALGEIVTTRAGDSDGEEAH